MPWLLTFLMGRIIMASEWKPLLECPETKERSERGYTPWVYTRLTWTLRWRWIASTKAGSQPGNHFYVQEYTKPGLARLYVIHGLGFSRALALRCESILSKVVHAFIPYTRSNLPLWERKKMKNYPDIYLNGRLVCLSTSSLCRTEDGILHSLATSLYWAWSMRLKKRLRFHENSMCHVFRPQLPAISDCRRE
jgi:hypothetical protein